MDLRVILAHVLQMAVLDVFWMCGVDEGVVDKLSKASLIHSDVQTRFMVSKVKV